MTAQQEFLEDIPLQRVSPENGVVSAPFIVDTTMVEQLFPETVNLAALILGADEEPQSVETHEPESIFSSRAQRRLSQNTLGNDEIGVQTALTYMVRDIPEVDRRSVIRQHLVSRLGDSPQMEMITDLWEEGVREQIIYLDTFKSASRQLKDRLGSMRANRGYQYGVMKLVANASFEQPFEKTVEEQTAHFSLVYALIDEDRETEETGVLTQWIEATTEGYFDDLLAEDVLRYVSSIDASELQEYTKTRALYKVVAACLPEARPEEVIARLRDARTIWPTDMQLSLNKARARMVEALQNCVKYGRQHMVARALAIPSDDPEAYFDATLRRLAASLPALNRIHNARPEQVVVSLMQQQDRRLHVARTLQAAQERKRRRVPQLTEASSEDNIAAAVEVQRVLRPVTVIDHHGAIHDRDSVEFARLLNDYLRPYNGNERRDIEAMLEWLGVQDFSRQVDGIKKYARPIRLGGVEYDVWGFKPADARGLSTPTKLAKKTRILFVQKDSSIAILRIAERSKVPTVERSLGIATGAKSS